MNLQVLLGYRILLQRTTDAEVFSGWVEFASDHELRITPTYDDFELEPGQKFNCAVTYQFATAHFQSYVTASNPREIRLMIEGGITLSSTDEDPRIRRVMRCEMSLDDAETEVEIVDVSNGGLALQSPVPIERGSKVSLRIPLKPMPLIVMGEVRYTVPNDDGQSFRAGVFFQNHDRITRGRWRQFIQQSAWEEMDAASSAA